MTDNPYASPPAPPEEEKKPRLAAGQQADLRELAIYQRILLVCLLGLIASYTASMFLSETPKEIARAAWLGFSLLSAVVTFLLALKVYGLLIGLLLGALTLVPCLNVIVVVCVNQAATSELQRSGVEVGLFGADFDTIH
jgi:hypothetical protein